MNKLITLLGILTVLVVSMVAATGQVNITSISSKTIFQSATYLPVTFNVAVNNSLDNSYINVTLSSTDLVSGSNIILLPTISNLNNVNGTPQTATFQLSIPANTPAGIYNANITAQEDGVPTNNNIASYTLTIIAGKPAISLVLNPTVNTSSTASVKAALSNVVLGSTIPFVTVSGSALTGPATIPAPSSVTLSNLATVTQQATLSISVPSNTPAGLYTGTLTAYETANVSNNATASYTITVNPTPWLGVTDISSIDLVGAPGDDIEQTFTLKNTGNIALTNINLSHDMTLKDSDNNAITIRFSSNPIVSLDVGASMQLTAYAEFPGSFDLQTFSGNMRFNSSQTTSGYINIIPMNVKAQLAACSRGNRGNIDIKIESPSNNDEFDPGQTITNEVRVYNRGGSSKKVVVEAYLYNVDKNKRVSYYKTSDKTIDSNDNTLFTFSLKMDTDTNEDDYRIFVKAYERSDEDNNCNQNSIQLKKIVPDDRLSIESFTMSPTTAACSDTVEALLQLRNIGSNDQDDVKVKLQNSYLGISQESSLFEMKSEDNEKSDYYQRLVFTVPKTAKDGTYTVGATVSYNSGLTEYKEQSLVIQNCVASATTTSGTGTTTGTSTQGASSQGTQSSTTSGSQVSYVGKDIFDAFNQTSSVPSTFWLLADALAFVGIVALLVAIFRPRH